jgi:hypothetical protein
MANFTNLLLIVVAINMVFAFTGIIDVPFSGIFQVIDNPANFLDFGFFLNFINDNWLTAGALLVFGIGTIFKSDIMIFAGMFGTLLTYIAPLRDLYLLIAAASSHELAVIATAPLMILYIMVGVAWWRGRAS